MVSPQEMPRKDSTLGTRYHFFYIAFKTELWNIIFVCVSINNTNIYFSRCLLEEPNWEKLPSSVKQNSLQENGLGLSWMNPSEKMMGRSVVLAIFR